MSEVLPSKITLVECPYCQKRKEIEIPGYVFLHKTVGVLKVQIHKNTICEHDFVAFIDQKGVARGYEKIDFQLQFTVRTEEDRSTTDRLFLEDVLETFGEFGTLNLFHAQIFNFKTMIILGPTENPSYVKRLNELLTTLFPPDWAVEAQVNHVSHRAFQKMDMSGSDSLVLDTSGLIAHTPWEEKERLDFERNLLRKGLEIIDPDSQTLILQQGILDLQHRCEVMLKILGDKKLVYDDDMKNDLSKKFGSKVGDYEVNLYKMFIQNRMPKKSKLLKRLHVRMVDKLVEGIW